jgi:hypothetical protein
MTALSSPIRRARSTKGLSAHLSAFVCGLLVVGMVMGVVNGARIYFYCVSMEQSAMTDCCDHAGDADSVAPAREARVSSSCCEARRFGKLVPAVEAPRPAPLAAPLVAILSAVSTTHARALRVSDEASFVTARAGPERPSALRSKLQVYLC